MKHSVLKIHPNDNVLVALRDLAKGQEIDFKGSKYTLQTDVQAKHKFTTQSLDAGDAVYMYGVLVGVAKEKIDVGSRITTSNLKHASGEYVLSKDRKTNWQAPEPAKWKNKTFMGYHRSDGSVGTANYWLIVPLVFCENRNVSVIREALLEELGYARLKKYNRFSKKLVDLYRAGATTEQILAEEFRKEDETQFFNPLFKNVDGVKFLNHEGGCGETRQDSQALCALLAGYITHPNVAGATVLSLGCQNAQISLLQDEIQKKSPAFDKPVYYLEQQKIGLESDMIAMALKQTFTGLMLADQCKREPAPISKLCIGLECGGSDGFSGISANPAIGYTSDLVVAAGGSVILSEFPELCGVEQEISDRCVNATIAQRFIHLMRVYNERAVAVGSGFDMNPSPGNIKDGLITDAIKSAGAAKKGGTSPVTDVLDYTEKSTRPGLNLLCTPGGDVESTTAEVGSGANIVLFTTGLGTPTGNPITPVIKLSTNTPLYQKMPDIIDIDTGGIVDGLETIEQAGERILDYVIKVASGEIKAKSVLHGQDDFIPWKRGLSL
jgi:altronate hydrolase